MIENLDLEMTESQLSSLLQDVPIPGEYVKLRIINYSLELQKHALSLVGVKHYNNNEYT